ncbi:MAG: hypothetical protein AAF602_01865 [Myxococcota bacterium]
MLDPTTGLNGYRTAPRPRESVTLGSCTASSPSPDAHEAAAALMARLDDGTRTVEEATEDHRHRLRTLFELPDDTKIALLPSGTDAIYLVSSLALTDADRVHHVVVGASELGGGTLRAARGQAISARAPHLEEPQLDLGAPLDGLAEVCSAEPVYLRDTEGRRREMAEVDAYVAQQVRQAAKTHRVVLHLVVHSKTGLRAPSTTACIRLAEELGDRLVVLVDAAQGRLAPRDVRRALSHGFIVLFTGSKFYSGPPFSGALLLPPPYDRDPGPLVEVLGDWFSRANLPPSWTDARASLRQEANPGLALRWEAAMHEIEAYHALSVREREFVYNCFSAAVYEAFGTSAAIDLHVPTSAPHELMSALGLQPTVFCFEVLGPDGPLPADQLRRLHTLVDTIDEGSAFHLGQPVALGPPGDIQSAVLRVALGARTVIDHAHEPQNCAARFRTTMYAARHRIEALVASGAVT